MKIVLAGGGTGGSVSPLLAAVAVIRRQHPSSQYLWIGTSRGPERVMVAAHQIPFRSIAAGKLRRYISWRNVVDPFLVLIGCLQSLWLLLRWRPAVVVSAGGFVAVPVIWMAWLVRIPVLIHQQDVVPGLANKLTAPFARLISVTFPESQTDFPTGKTVVIGNPVRPEMYTGSVDEGQRLFHLIPNRPTILVIGGGTGALRLNQLVTESLSQLIAFCQIIHLTGARGAVPANSDGYQSYAFLNQELPHAYAVADVVVTRAGMSVLTELAALAKPAIIMPIANSHQEQNATAFARRNAAVVIDERIVVAASFVEVIQSLVADGAARERLSQNIGHLAQRDAADHMASLMLRLATKSKV